MDESGAKSNEGKKQRKPKLVEVVLKDLTNKKSRYVRVESKNKSINAHVKKKVKKDILHPKDEEIQQEIISNACEQIKLNDFFSNSSTAPCLINNTLSPSYKRKPKTDHLIIVEQCYISLEDQDCKEDLGYQTTSPTSPIIQQMSQGLCSEPHLNHAALHPGDAYENMLHTSSSDEQLKTGEVTLENPSTFMQSQSRTTNSYDKA